MARVKPDKNTNLIITIIGIIGVIGWFAIDYVVDTGPDIFYGQYGALLFGGITAVIASLKKRNVVAWFAIGSWTVIAGLIVIICMPKLHDAACTYCQKGISDKAIACPYCQRDLEKVS